MAQQEELPVGEGPEPVAAPDDEQPAKKAAKKTAKKSTKKAAKKAAKKVSAAESRKAAAERMNTIAERGARRAIREEKQRQRERAEAKAAKKKGGKKVAKKKTSKHASKRAPELGAKTPEGKEGTFEGTFQCSAHAIPLRGLGEDVSVEYYDGREWRPITPEGSSTALVPVSGDHAVVPARPSVIQRVSKQRRQVAIGVGAAALVVGGLYLITSRKAAASGPVHGSVASAAGSMELPPPIAMGNIPAEYTRIYQLFDRYVEGGKEFFANVGDSESGNQMFNTNPKGVALSKAGVERQMKDPNYGKAWTGKGEVPYTAYLEPEKAKELPAMGLFQGVAGTIGQAGRRNGTAILAPRPVATWMEPALQLAASMELFGALYHKYGAQTPEQMRIAWGLPGKADEPDDPYYVDRAQKFKERQVKTGVTAIPFKNMRLWDVSVDEVIAYFSQFNYGQFVRPRSGMIPMMGAPPPLSLKAQARLSAQLSNPAFIGNDWSD